VFINADEYVASIRFRADEVLSSSNSILRRFRTNAPYDPDPNVGGNSALGFVTLMAMYNYYRVIDFHVDLQIANNEAYAINLNCVHTNSDPTSTISFPQQALQSYGFTTMVGPAVGSNSIVHYTRNLSMRELVGDKVVKESQRYDGTATTIPDDVTFFGFNVVDPIGSFTNGVTYKVVITMRTVFYDRKNLDDVTLSSKEPPSTMKVKKIT